MQRPAHLHLALDVQHLAAAQAHPRGDATGLAEGELAELQHGEPVHLPYRLAVGVDEQGLPQDLLLAALAHPVGAPGLGVDGPLHVPGADLVPPFLAGPVVGLVEQVVDGAQAQGQALGVGGQPRRPLDDPRRGFPRKRPQPLAARGVGDHAGVARRVAVVTRHLFVEVRGHLEKLGEVRVGPAQQVVDHRVAQQDHLDVEGDGLGLQCDRVGEAQGLGEPLDADLVGLERALDLLPDDGLHEQLARVHQQETPVGGVQRARLDEAEIGGESAEPGHLLNAPDDVAVGGQVFVDHGGALPPPVVDDDVHLVAAEGGLPSLLAPGQPARLRRRRPGGVELFGVLLEVRAHLLDVVHDLGQVVVVLAQLLDEQGHRVAHHLLVEAAHPLAPLALPLGRLLENLLQLLLQLGDVRAHLRLGLLGPLAKGFRAHHLALGGGRQGEPRGGADQAHAARLGVLLQLVERGFLALAELRLKGLGSGLVLLALESRGNGRAQLADELLHVGAEPAAPAGRQLERARLVGLLEVVDVAPVGRRRHSGRRLLDVAPDERVLAGAGRAVGEDVVAMAPDADAEPDRLQRTLLAEAVRGRAGLAG